MSNLKNKVLKHLIEFLRKIQFFFLGKRYVIENNEKLLLKGAGNFYQYFNNKGQLHRTNGPAEILKGYYEHYYLNGKKHRTDGPACRFMNDLEFYYYNGKIILNLNGEALSKIRKFENEKRMKKVRILM